MTPLSANEHDPEPPPAMEPAAGWEQEKVLHQNPRIRAVLGCIRLLDDAAESDYHLLHCAPRRLLQVWQKLRELAGVLRTGLPPILAVPSTVPELDRARHDASIALTLLGHTVLAEIEGFPEDPPPEMLLDLRKLLCSAVGQLKFFLYESYSRIVAADPRSAHDVDYYLSRRFPADIDESAWLLESVGELGSYLSALEEDRQRLLEMVAAQLLHEQRMPGDEAWSRLSTFIVSLNDDLTTRLREILCLHGIRFEEMTSLKRYSIELPAKCLKVLEIHELGVEIFDAFERAGTHGTEAVRQECQTALTMRLGRLVGDLDSTLRDLMSFVPLWQHNIEHRRALSLEEVRSSGGQSAARQVAVAV